ncbi:MAG: EpsG family protein [Erysipelotrichia bacterium]|nr:EpsG family protein [Erysipelotrichia bacterium]
MIVSKNLTISSKTLVLILIGILLILIAGLRPIGIDGDSLNYISVLHLSLSEANFIDKEPTFWIINELNKILFAGNDQTFFLIFAIIGVSLKLYVIRQYSISPILSLLTYISMFFILHEMTQIRSGVAIGFVFWALFDLVQKRNVSFLIKILIATLFHYSAIVMLILYFLSRNKINCFFYFSLPFVGLFFSSTNVMIEIIYQPKLLVEKMV